MEAAVKKSEASPEYNANNICTPIVDFGVAIEARLEHLNNAAKARSANKISQEANAAQRKE